MFLSGMQMVRLGVAMLTRRTVSAAGDAQLSMLFNNTNRFLDGRRNDRSIAPNW